MERLSEEEVAGALANRDLALAQTIDELARGARG